MDLHPGPNRSNVSENGRAELDPIRRALQENEDWYQDLVEHSQNLLCIHDLEGRLLSVNPEPARTLGLQRGRTPADSHAGACASGVSRRI